MNRILNWADEAPSILASAELPAPALALSGPDSSRHCLFTPQHYEPNYAYPLVVWLHGPGDDERQVTRVMPLVSLRNYAAVAPRGTEPAQQADGYSWRQTTEHVTEAEQRVVKAIAAARHSLNIAAHRIYLAGYDTGGTMALRIALSQPHWFAGVASIGGAFPTNLRPLARIKELRGLQILLATGRHSRRYPESQVCRTLRLLHSAGMSVNLRQYPCGDEVTTDTFADLDRWIMEQVATTASAIADQASHSSRGK